MSAAPRVSVIVPVFNRPAFVGEAVRSALSQECPGGLEVVVVDDGSTDETPAVLADLTGEDDRVRVFRQENAGPAVARNRAFEEARGEFLALLDSDDIWLPEKLARQVALLDAHPAAGLAHGEVEEFFEGEARAWRHRPAIVSGSVLATLLRRNVLHTMTVMLRREVIDEVGGFDPEYPPCEDWDLWLRIAERREIVGDPAAHVRVRIHAGGISSDPLVVYRQATRLLAAAAARLGLAGPPSLAAEARKQCARWNVKYGRRLAREGRKRDAQAAFEAAVRVHPPARLAVLKARLLPKR